MDTPDAAKMFEAMGSPTRLALYRLLVRAGPAGMSVGECQQRLELPQSTLSFHLKALIRVGLVTQERQRTTLICRVNYDLMNGLVHFLVSECCADSRAAGCQASAA